MTITFYLGKERKELLKKFEGIKRHYGKHLNARYSDSDCFRYIVRLLYDAVIKAELKNNNKTKKSE